MDLVLGQDAFHRVAVQLALCALVGGGDGEYEVQGYNSIQGSKAINNRGLVTLNSQCQTENRLKAAEKHMKTRIGRT